MADVFTKRKRSEVMARIRSRGNRDTEMALARLLRAHGIKGWRRQLQVRIAERGTRSSSRGDEAQTVTPKPNRASSRQLLQVRSDFVFPKERVAVFVDGCFWHGCPKHSRPKRWLRKSSMPAKPTPVAGKRTGRAFWQGKLAANQARDRKVNRALRRAGWRVVRIWEHELRKYEVRSPKSEKRRAKGAVPLSIRRIQGALNR